MSICKITGDKKKVISSINDKQRKMEKRDRNQNPGTLKRLDSIQDPGKRYALKDRVGVGICGDVYEGIDQQAGM